MPAGAYRIRFTTGNGWLTDHFTRDDAYLAFTNPVRFLEADALDGVRYDEVSLTLHVVRDGNAKTQAIPPFRLGQP